MASKRIAALRRIVKQKQYAKIDGVLVDLFSASAIVKVYDALSAANKKKLASLPVPKMAKISLSLMKNPGEAWHQESKREYRAKERLARKAGDEGLLDYYSGRVDSHTESALASRAGVKNPGMRRGKPSTRWLSMWYKSHKRRGGTKDYAEGLIGLSNLVAMYREGFTAKQAAYLTSWHSKGGRPNPPKKFHVKKLREFGKLYMVDKKAGHKLAAQIWRGAHLAEGEALAWHRHYKKNPRWRSRKASKQWLARWMKAHAKSAGRAPTAKEVDQSHALYQVGFTADKAAGFTASRF